MFTKCVQRCTAAVKLVRLQTSRRHPSVSASVRGGHKRLCGFHIKIKKRLAYCSPPERMGESCNVIEWSMSPRHLVLKSYSCDCCQTSNIINESFPFSCNSHNLSFRNVFSCPWLVFVHIWHFAADRLPRSPLQVQAEAKASPKATVGIASKLSVS